MTSEKKNSKFQNDSPDANFTINERSIVKNNILMFLIITGGFYYGYFTIIMGTMGLKFVHLKFDYPLKEAEEIVTRLNVVFPIGALLSCTTTGYWINKVGRMRMLLISEQICMYTYIMYSTGNLYCIFIARFLGGAISALIPTLSVVTCLEILPDRLKNTSGNFLAFFCGSGFATVSFIGYFGHTENYESLDLMTTHWQVIQVWPGIISMIRLIGLLYFKFDTPKYYLMKYGVKGGLPFVRKSLNNIYGDEKSVKIVERQIVDAHNATAENKDVVFQDLFKKDYRRRFAAGVIVNMGQQLVGIGFFSLYGVYIFDRVTGNGSVMNLIVQFSCLTGTYLSIKFLERYGRRFAFLLGLFCNTLAYIILALGFYYLNKYLLAFAVVFFILTYSMGLGSTIYVYQAEIQPPVGLGAASCAQWIACIIVGGLTPTFVNEYGLIWVSFGFAGICILFYILIDFVCLETSGKTQEKIANNFRTKEYKSASIKSIQTMVDNYKEISRRNCEINGGSHKSNDQMMEEETLNEKLK